MPSTSHKSKQSRPSRQIANARTRPRALAKPLLRSGLRGQLVRELRRRELEQNQKDGFRGPNRRARRARGSTNTQGFRKPQALELPGKSPILASLPPADFSRVLADVHHEFEQEIEKPENEPRSLT